LGDTAYSINAPDVIAETIDGETILVNLATGSYYSLEGAGPEVWSRLVAGLPPGVVSEECARIFDAAPGEIEAAVARLIDDLRAEQIIVESPSVARELPPTGPPSKREPFVAPTLKKFTDMQDIILLDPVHEVDARGWPHQAEDVGATTPD
jgi:hypothetical protein